jgi:nicotinamidase-related amidase
MSPLTLHELPLPDFFKEGNSYDPDYAPDINHLRRQATDWTRLHGIKPVGADKVKVSVLDIDSQFDFSFSQGTLFVAGRSGQGAQDAHNRKVQWGYKYLWLWHEWINTLDSHVPYQVFFPTAHRKADGTMPDEHTIIKAEDYVRGLYQADPAMAASLNVNPAWLTRQWTYYCNELEKVDPKTGRAKHQLYLWPFHCPLGSKGHRLAGVVDELRFFHSFVRGARNTPAVKGTNPMTEHYSIFKPEVLTTWEGKPIPGAQRNSLLIERLFVSDMVIMMGLASDYCVAESIYDFLGEIQAKDPELAKKVYVVKDLTAPVVIPGIYDGTDVAEKAFADFAAGGMNVVESTTPIQEWPGAEAILARARN